MTVDEKESMMAEPRIINGIEAARGAVREFALSDHDTVLCIMYVDLNPIDCATMPARRLAVASALDEAGRTAPDSSWQAEFDDLRDAIEATDDEIGEVQGLLVIASRSGQSTIVKLPRPVPRSVEWRSAVPVRPLVEALPSGERWCVLLCNRRDARLFVGDEFELTQVIELHDDVDGQHAQGGWSQSRFQRNIEGQVTGHLRDAARALRVLHERDGFDHLLVGAPDELHGLIRSELHDSTRRTLLGFIDIDVENATGHDVEAAAHRHMRDLDDARTDEVLARLRQGIGRRRRVAQGLAEVLHAISESRVDTLVIASHYATPGWACLHGDWTSAVAEKCPVHGIDIEPVADIVEVAIEMVVRQEGHVVNVARTSRDGADRPQHRLLTRLGSIAALLRYDLDESAAR